MKTIFEGTVNGTKFDKVEDYNKALIEAINSGKAVNASSTTRQEEDEDKKTPQSCVLPVFDLDTLTGNGRHDSNLFQAFTEHELGDTSKHVILNNLHTMNDADAAELLIDYKDQVKNFQECLDANEKAYDKLLNEIADAQQRLDDLEVKQTILDYSQDILNHEIDFYNEIIDRAGTKEEEQPKKTTHTLDEYYDQLAHARRLLDEIFG